MSIPSNLRGRVVTRYGRVVYNRKKHGFSIRDLLRIGRKLTPELVEICLDDEDFDTIVSAVLEKYRGFPAAPLLVGSWVDGMRPVEVKEFGGAGGSRGFEDPDYDPATVISILVSRCSITKE
jgi:hypothetical protein